MSHQSTPKQILGEPKVAMIADLKKEEAFMTRMKVQKDCHIKRATSPIKKEIQRIR